jgi:hypothetical protein
MRQPCDLALGSPLTELRRKQSPTTKAQLLHPAMQGPSARGSSKSLALQSSNSQSQGVCPLDRNAILIHDPCCSGNFTSCLGQQVLRQDHKLLPRYLGEALVFGKLLDLVWHLDLALVLRVVPGLLGFHHLAKQVGEQVGVYLLRPASRGVAR